MDTYTFQSLYGHDFTDFTTAQLEFLMLYADLSLRRH